MPYFLFIIFTVYTMLPFQLWDAVVLSVLTSLSHILVLTLNFTVFHRDATTYLAGQVSHNLDRTLNDR